MTRTVGKRFPRAGGVAAALFLFLLACVPFRGYAAGTGPAAEAEPFPGYPADVRERALRLIDAAEPGKEELLEPEVRALRKAMLEYSIVSMNDIPDRIFGKARKEGWEGKAGRLLRPVTRVAPYSAALWAWLVREDLSTFGLGRLIRDIEGFKGSLLRYGPSLLGCAAWIFLCLMAAASWFAVWASISLLLRAQPALASDFSRPFRKLPHPEIFGFLAFLACLLAPVLAGIGMGVAAIFWFALSAGYLRRWEITMAIFSMLLLGAVYVCGGALQSVAEYTGEAGRRGWLGGEGYLSVDWKEAEPATGSTFDGSRRAEMVLFARARAEMQAGNNEKAESLWDEWIRNAKEPSAGLNNRGIVRHRLGKTSEALKDFEKAVSEGPRGGPANWNAYQTYLRTFRLEEAAKVQEAAWGSLRELRFFDYRAEEMTHGELVPSPLLVGDVWKELFTPRREWLKDSGEGSFFRFLFRPLPVKWVPAFIVLAVFWMILWKPLSTKIWMHGTCRSCGTRALVVGGAEATDICNQCRAQVGGGIRAGEEREQRLLYIQLHRRYVRACSVVVPGAGALWAGKGLAAMVYGILLSLVLGVLTVSTGAGRPVPPLISEMMDGAAKGALAVLALLWILGVAWSWKSFTALQFKYNIVPRR
jgi:tetratricopeptide (TPR) repeat protein